MPKPSRGKKSKGEEPKKSVVQKAKKSKGCRTTTSTRQQYGAKTSSQAQAESDSDIELEVLQPDFSNQCNVDETLDRNASKTNLSAFNVKSIIHVSHFSFN